MCHKALSCTQWEMEKAKERQKLGRGKDTQKKGNKSSMHSFNFDTRHDFYKRLWQNWEAGE